MGNFLWVKTKEREKLLKAAKKIPEFGKMTQSDILEWALRELVKKHGKSNNPQTQIDLFQNPEALAIPNIYADDEAFINFFNKLSDANDFAEIDKQLQMISRASASIRYQKNEEGKLRNIISNINLGC